MFPGKCAKNLNFSRNFNSIMKDLKGYNKQILLDNVKMDGSINFHANGDINLYP